MYANGFGSAADESPVSASSPLPISSLSKTLTALAVLKLVEDGQLELSERVFGSNGIMSRFTLDIVDPRMMTITVEHLLRHTAGWDEHRGPVYDPMLNKVFIARGYKIEDIEELMAPHSELNPMDIIRYMAGKSLAFTPGTMVKYSNFGYCLLGRIIEEIADMDYETFVHHNILRPAGMIHTKIGLPLAVSYADENIKDATIEIDSQLIHSLIDPELLDSTLGWYSSVHDISRLTISLMYPNVNQLLKPETLELMFRRPTQAWTNPQTWYGIGLHVRNDGAFWQESDRFDNDGIVYHVGIRGFTGQNSKLDASLLRDDITIITLTTNNRFRKLKSAMERMVPYIKAWPLASLKDRSTEDLADVKVKTTSDDVLMKYHLPEQQLQAYVNALRLSEYVPVWFHGYRQDGTTHFAVISRRVYDSNALHFRLEISNFPKRLRDRVHNWETGDDYRVAFIQSYISASHGDTLTHLVLLNKSREQYGPRSLRWGVNVKLQDYLAMLMKRTKKGYTLTAQSVSVPNQDATVDYIVTRVPSSADRSYYASYHDLSLQQLEIVAKSNAVKQFSLQYLDTHHSPNDEDNEPRFSAVFSKSKNAKWILQVGVKMENVITEARNWETRGYVPKILVGYMQNNELNFAALWVM